MDSETYPLYKLSSYLLTFSTAFFYPSIIVGIPGVKASLLEEYGVRLVTYDLPGFGESDPHPNRNFNSSALDMLHLVNAVNVTDKFWVLCHSSGCIHAWASLRYIPERIAGCSSFSKF
jgi:pimeloyl-ACP methyl ester carboxylesterase